MLIVKVKLNYVNFKFYTLNFFFFLQILILTVMCIKSSDFIIYIYSVNINSNYILIFLLLNIILNIFYFITNALELFFTNQFFNFIYKFLDWILFIFRNFTLFFFIFIFKSYLFEKPCDLYLIISFNFIEIVYKPDFFEYLQFLNKNYPQFIFDQDEAKIHYNGFRGNFTSCHLDFLNKTLLIQQNIYIINVLEYSFYLIKIILFIHMSGILY